MKLLFILTFLSAFLPVFVAAQDQDAFNISVAAGSCVSPQGFRQCWRNATQKAVQCYRTTCATEAGDCSDPFTCSATGTSCMKQCVCTAHSEWLNCAVSYCHNKVYSCAYQALAIQALEKCSLANRFPPFWPPPAGVRSQGACNCHIGEAYKAIREYAIDRNQCNANINSLASSLPMGQNATYHKQCDCCAADGQLNALGQYCPRLSKPIAWWGRLAPLTSLSSRYNATCGTVLPTIFASASAFCAASPISITLNATTAASKLKSTFVPVTYTSVVTYTSSSLVAASSGSGSATITPAPSASTSRMVKRQDFGGDDVTDDSGSFSLPSGTVFTWEFADGITMTATAAAATAASASSGSAVSGNFAIGRNGNNPFVSFSSGNSGWVGVCATLLAIGTAFAAFIL